MEIWKSVKNYEGIYEVSNLGNVKRINGKTLGVNKKYSNGYILKPLDNGMGYLRVKLSKDNKSKRVLLHKIIAQSFIENTNNYKTVNHKNGIKSDNRIENLEWCTQSENCKHAFIIGLSSFTENKRVAMLENFKKGRGWNKKNAMVTRSQARQIGNVNTTIKRKNKRVQKKD